MISLIDGDLVVYMAASVAATTFDFDDGDGPTAIVDHNKAVDAAMRMIREWTKRSGGKRCIVFLSEGDSFRKKLWPAYKSNRPDRPEAWGSVRDAIELEYDVHKEAGLEADDLLGITAMSDKAQSVIVSRDKDLQTIPAILFNPDIDVKPRRITPSKADENWFFQAMTGDQTDNYPGIPKVGPVTAREILMNPRRLEKRGKKWVYGERCSLWQSMLDHTVKAGLDATHLIKMAQVSRILRAGDFDETRRVVLLWTPAGHTELPLD